MKTIERLRELANKPESIDQHAFNLAIVACGRGLLAVAEAAEAYMLEENPAKWRDQRVKLFESVAALRAMEGGSK